MNEHRTAWMETFTSFVQFYPKLSARIAIETMAAAGRMLPNRPSADGDVDEVAPPLVPAITKLPTKKSKPVRNTKRSHRRK